MTERMEGPTTTIEGVTYGMNLWPTSRALDWAERLSGVVAEPGAYVLADDWPTAIRTLLQRLRDTQTPVSRHVQSIIADNVFVQEASGALTTITPSDFEVRFRGKLSVTLKLAAWVLRENLGDFTEGVRSIAEVLAQRWRDALNAASGPSGEDLQSAMRVMNELETLTAKLQSSSQSPQTSEGDDSAGSTPA